MITGLGRWDALKETLQGITKDEDPKITGTAKWILGMMEEMEKSDAQFYTLSGYEPAYGFMPVWHSMEDVKPSQPGDYLVLSDLGPSSSYVEEGKDCGLIGVARWYPRGLLIPYYPQKEKTAYKETTDRILYPHYWETKEGWYELDDSDVGMRLLNEDHVVFWANLPKIPGYYAGDQNVYSATWFNSLQKANRKTIATLDSVEDDDRK